MYGTCFISQDIIRWHFIRMSGQKCSQHTSQAISIDKHLKPYLFALTERTDRSQIRIGAGFRTELSTPAHLPGTGFITALGTGSCGKKCLFDRLQRLWRHEGHKLVTWLRPGLDQAFSPDQAQTLSKHIIDTAGRHIQIGMGTVKRNIMFHTELDVVMNDMVVQSLMKKADTDTKVVSLAFGADQTEGRFVVAAAPDSGITEPADLEGKRVAISTNTMMEYLMDQYESYYKLDAESIELVNMPDLMLRVETLLSGNDIDAAILPDPLATFALSKGAVSVIDDTTLEENFSQSVYLATDDFLTNHKPALDGFMDVLFAAMTDINENPDKYRDLLMEKANVPEELRDTYPMPTYSPGTVPSEQEVARLEAWLVENQLLDKVYSYYDLVDTTYSEEEAEN